MILDINQAKIALADKYKIYKDEQPEPTYRAARKLFRVFAEVDLFRDSGDEPLLTVKKRFSPFRATYDIRRNGEAYAFRTLSIIRHHYQCTIGADLYEVYGHRGRKYSIFKNDQQIGWWDKAAITWFAGDNYRITCDDDADIEILTAFCLIIDNYRSDDHDDQTVTYDVGNLFQGRKFDPDWKPKVARQPG